MSIVFRYVVLLIKDNVNKQTNIAIELKLLRIPAGGRLTSYAVEELNSGLPKPNPDSALNHWATLPP